MLHVLANWQCMLYSACTCITMLHLQAPLSELKNLKWKEGKNWPFAMWYYPRMTLFKEKVYIGGGLASSVREERTVIVYDPKHDSYDTLPPYTYKWFSMAVVNNQLVLIGGREVQAGKRRTNKLGVWNEQSRSWTHPLPPMTTACSSSSVATHNNRWLVVMGGWDDETRLSKVEILDATESGQWYLAASLPQPLCHVLPAIIGNMCYLLGGSTEGGASKKVFSVCLDDLITQAISQQASASAPAIPSPWHSLPNTPLIYSTTVAFNGALLAVGGGDLRGSTAIYSYQPSSRSWINAGELPTERWQCTCTVLPNGGLYVAGGSDKQVDIASVE